MPLARTHSRDPRPDQYSDRATLRRPASPEMTALLRCRSEGYHPLDGRTKRIAVGSGSRRHHTVRYFRQDLTGNRRYME